MSSPAPTFPVAVRIRPRLPGEEGKSLSVSEQGGEVRVSGGHLSFKSSYPNVFTSAHTQQDVYSFVSPYISKVKKGYSTAVLAYGETGSGKTYTMFGPDWEDPVTCGLIPRALKQLYEELTPNIGQGRTYAISASYVLICNEKLYDLQRPIHIQEPLRVWDDSQGLIIEGITDTPVLSLSDCLAVVRAGEANRLSASSIPQHKSHSVLHIKIESGKLCPHERLHRMKVDFCDLGGSEKDPNDSASMKISIETFGKVVSMLTTGKSGSNIPYAESKLTRLLQYVLQQNCNTCLVATVSPAQENASSTIETLKCALNISQIPLKPIKKTVFVDQGVLNSLQTELQNLRKALKSNNPAAIEEFKYQVLSNGLFAFEVEKLLEQKEEEKQAISKGSKPERHIKISFSEVALSDVKKSDSSSNKGTGFVASGQHGEDLHHSQTMFPDDETSVKTMEISPVFSRMSSNVKRKTTFPEKMDIKRPQNVPLTLPVPLSSNQFKSVSYNPSPEDGKIPYHRIKGLGSEVGGQSPSPQPIGSSKSDSGGYNPVPSPTAMTPGKLPNVKNYMAASFGSFTPKPTIPSYQTSGNIGSPSADHSPVSVRSSAVLDTGFDNLVLNQTRGRNDKRSATLIGAKQAINSFTARANGIMQEEDPATRERRQMKIDLELKKIDEEKNQGKQRLEQRIDKDRQEQEALRKRLERPPAIEPRPLRPKKGEDKLTRLLTNDF